VDKDNKRRDFLKHVWTAPVIISLGALITPASAKRDKGGGKGGGKGSKPPKLPK